MSYEVEVARELGRATKEQVLVMEDASGTSNLETRSRVIHWAFWYDVMLKVRAFGREGRVRERFLDLAGVGPGETVLDAGCGPGTMAIIARRRVGNAGAVYGIDAAPEMIERARAKAASAGVDVSFQPALLEAIPFPDATFDVVITSFVLHHFPADMLDKVLTEVRRVLKPNGRLVAFDFTSSGHRHGLFARRIHPHSTFDLNEVTPALNAAGLVVRERGSAGFAQAVYLKATPGASNEQRDLPPATATAASRGLSHLAFVATLATLIISMAAIATFFLGQKWMWIGAGTATALLAFHVATFHVAVVLGGTSLLGYAARWFHRMHHSH
ncbi:MAG TPA: class I SAM-dependent methyltransferase [Candidatus Binataceae bacterium]|nr:class I SAM-dependent methyltransferase [Candidatus Binataceae bacterium]